MAREIVNRIQNIRKNSDFEVTDRIVVTLQQHEAIATAIAHFSDYIKSEVLADDLIVSSGKVEGEKVELANEVEIAIRIVKQ
jgi:isoleucyl-tRNA synthetase